MNVYLVDDSMEMIHSMKEALTKSDGYQVIGSATNGEQCVNELRGKHLDVLVLDLIMPKKDGISVLHDLKKNHIQVDHIICTTPFVNDLIVAGVQNYRIDYILMKPFEIEQLCDKLNFIVGYTRKEHISSNVVKVNLDDDEKERLQKLSSQPLSLRFQNALIMGDSLAEAFGDYQLVSSSNLLATRGRRTDNIDQEIATAISLAPRTIFLSYGMNDLEYCRGNAQRFIRQYKKQIHKLKEALPDTKIFINSLIPMDAAAIAQVPVYARYKEFNEALKQMCEEEQITYIDTRL